jgi:hypothetical protein
MILIAAASLMAAGCGIAVEDAHLADRVRQDLDSQRFTLAIEHMYPTRGAARYVGGDSYTLKVDGDKVRSHLPYVGTAYQVPYGGGKVLNFEDDIEEYHDGFDERGRRIIAFTTDNGEDFIIFTLTIFENGRTDLLVRSKNREQISYRGRIDPDASPKEEE